MSWYIAAEFPLDTDLRRLHHYLQSCGITHRIIEEHGRQALLLSERSPAIDIHAMLTELESATHRGADFEGERGEVLSTTMARVFVRARQNSLTASIILLGLLGFAAFDLSAERLVNGLALGTLPYIIGSGEVWRLITPAFLHFAWWHWLFNGLLIWHLGTRLELFLGRSLYTALFLFSAVVANLAQYFVGGDGYFGGLSGVVYAYVGCVFLLHRLRPHALLAVGEGLFIFMLVWLVLGFSGAVSFFVGGGIANWAHLGGLIAGMIFAALIHLLTRKKHS